MSKRLKIQKEKIDFQKIIPNKLISNDNDEVYLLTFSTDLRINQHIELITELALRNMSISSCDNGILIREDTEGANKVPLRITNTKDNEELYKVANTFLKYNTYLSDITAKDNNATITLFTKKVNMKKFLSFTKHEDVLYATDISLHWAFDSNNEHIIQIDIYFPIKVQNNKVLVSNQND